MIDNCERRMLYFDYIWYSIAENDYNLLQRHAIVLNALEGRRRLLLLLLLQSPRMCSQKGVHRVQRRQSIAIIKSLSTGPVLRLNYFPFQFRTFTKEAGIEWNQESRGKDKRETD